jgi:thioredoxin 1
MKKVLGLFTLLMIVMSFTTKSVSKSKQEDVTGIVFKHISLEDAKKQAVKSGKIIFIDAYTSWCGPCKKMAATTFKDEAVAKLFNQKFINLKIDVENDLDGPEIEKMYKVQAYPTMLFIDGKGKLKKSILGFHEPDQLLGIAKSIN